MIYNALRSIPGGRLVTSTALCVVLATVFAAPLVMAPAPSDAQLPDLDLPAFGLGSPSGKQVSVTSRIVAGQGGAPSRLEITARMQPGWHIYAITQKGGPQATRITLEHSNDFALLGGFQATAPATIHRYEDIWPGVDVAEHEGTVTWYAPIKPLRPEGLAGLVISGEVSGQVCKDTCVLFSDSFVARAKVQPAAGGQLTEPPPSPSDLIGSRAPRAPTWTSTYKSDNVTITGALTPGIVEPGGRAQLTITAKLADNSHISAYEKKLPSDPQRARPTLISLGKRSGFEAGRPRPSSEVISYPRPGVAGYFDNWHRDVSWTIDLVIPENAPRGDHQLDGMLGFLAANGTQGGTPHGVRFQVHMKVGEATTKDPAKISFIEATYQQAADAAATAPPWDLVIPQAAPATMHKILINMGWALIAGILLNVMPCVLPVIGLKIMSFVQQGGEDRKRIFALNVAYSMGMISIFLVLAAFAAFAGLAWAEQFQDPRFGIGMAALVFVFALSLLGIWEIPIPGFVGSSTAHSIAEREGISAAVFKGMLTTLLATPCVGPFMFTGLTFAAEQHSAAITFAIFASMGFGMATPFLLIGAFPALIRFLPKPGAWMESFKHFMGFVLLATVVWIFYAFVPDEYFVATLAFLFALWMAIWWANRTPVTAAVGDRLAAWGIATLLAVLIGYGSFAFLSEEKPVAVDTLSTQPALAVNSENGVWQPFTPAALDAFRNKGTTVFVDFTADG